MEKKGEILTQLAVISDLIEKINLTYESATMIFNVSDAEFTRIYNYTSEKNGGNNIQLKNEMKTFSINISNTNIIISKNNV